MSFDLAVFDAAVAPRDKAGFKAWFDEQISWDEDHSYDDPRVSTPALQAFFEELSKTFPPLNGPFSPLEDELNVLDRDEEAYLTDYSMGKTLIYMGFAWSLADEAEQAVRLAAEHHAVGFYHLSYDEVLFPDDPRSFLLNTNQGEVEKTTWSDVAWFINKLKDTSSKANGEFVYVEEKNLQGVCYIQIMYFPGEDTSGYYQMEAMEKEYAGNVLPQHLLRTSSIDDVKAVLSDWIVWGCAPDFSTWEHGDASLDIPSDKNARANNIVRIIIIIVFIIVLTSCSLVFLKDVLA